MSSLHPEPHGSAQFSKVVMTGVSGFIGQHVATALLRTGYDVSVIVRSGSNRDRIPVGARIYEHDGSTDGMISILSQNQPDLVMHLASCFLARHTSNDLEALVDSNLRFGLQLLEAMSRTGCRRLINTGTGWQHFMNRDNDPVCLYAATKSAFENLIDYYVAVEGFVTTTLKLHDTYGPNDTRGKLIAILMSAARDDTPLDLSPGEQKIDLVHVDDVVGAFIKSMDLDRKEEIGRHHKYMVSSGNPISIRELVGLIESVTGRRIRANWGARPYREREVMIPWNIGDTPPGWAPVVSLSEGIEQLWKTEEA